ncbi:magnesium or manganese-dependent protein phosphatase [Streptomyces viridochromogenes DSM 40736]|uniref:Magnesium or manganese-dependent protein phosphatase n=1 Tax=Streptomyces viridochromogenes (strain DSM 40736 / JCM 4977 / BCRC 1201 / Tue 494) TaxID=591159 RepID=D9X4I1_STRVT|nr:magnesium or manganese-dependent protein phosphatase [Streptomyces viridochromogenes DSM 40736]
MPANELAPAATRKFLRAVLAERTAPQFPGAPTISARSVDDAVLLVSELVTSAVAHTGSEVEVACRLEADPVPAADSEPAAAGWVDVVVEVVEQSSSGCPDDRRRAQSHVRGYARHLMRALAESWGVTYRHTGKATWFRLECALVAPPAATERSVTGPLAEAFSRGRPAAGPGPAGPAPPRERPGRRGEWAEREGQWFLAEAGELLAGQLDEDMVAALAGQLLVPRLADWCGVWLTTDNAGLRLSRVWHVDERRIGPLRLALEIDRPTAALSTTGVPWPWPRSGGDENRGGSALAFPLVAGGRYHGTLLIGQAGLPELTDIVVRLLEDVARRMAQAVVTARHYTRQASISRTLQRRQLPTSLAAIPGVDTAIVYEPWGEGQTVGGDFYDLFPVNDRRWCFLLGDVSGHDVEAMSVTGMARHLVRLLAREGHGVESLLNRLNHAMAEESAEAMALRGEQEGSRFLSLLYGELEPDSIAGGTRCTIASAGHPPPLRLATDGSVTPAANPQMLLGVEEHAEFHADSFTLAPGETLLCVTDGVTERRNGTRQLDDDDGLAEVLHGCMGLGAKAVAERIRRTAHDFSTEPIDDDLAILVLEAVPVLRTAGAVATALQDGGLRDGELRGGGLRGGGLRGGRTG